MPRAEAVGLLLPEFLLLPPGLSTKSGTKHRKVKTKHKFTLDFDNDVTLLSPTSLRGCIISIGLFGEMCSQPFLPFFSSFFAWACLSSLLVFERRYNELQSGEI